MLCLLVAVHRERCQVILSEVLNELASREIWLTLKAYPGNRGNLPEYLGTRNVLLTYVWQTKRISSTAHR